MHISDKQKGKKTLATMALSFLNLQNTIEISEIKKKEEKRFIPVQRKGRNSSKNTFSHSIVTVNTSHRSLINSSPQLIWL